MENLFEKNIQGKEEKQSKKAGKKMSRREFLKILAAGTAGAMAPGFIFSKKAKAEGWDDYTGSPSRYEKHGWGYSLEEMKEVYEKEYNSDKKILKNTFFRKNKKLFGIADGKEFSVSQDFVEKTRSFLKEMLDKKTARYLFRLDAFHGHLFAGRENYESNYAKLDCLEQAQKVMKDDNAGVIFHNTEHLKVDNNILETVELNKRRNVLGWFDKSPIEILPLPKGKVYTSVVTYPNNGQELVPYFKFAAHKNGEFSIEVDNEEIRFDISFDDENYF